MAIPNYRLPVWGGIYRDLHRHPELSLQEHLRDIGYEVTEGVEQTGVVGGLRNGAGPVVLLRGDMDALAVKEQSKLSETDSGSFVMILNDTIRQASTAGHLA